LNSGQAPVTKEDFSRKGAKVARCHFDLREKSFPNHKQLMQDCRLCFDIREESLFGEFSFDPSPTVPPLEYPAAWRHRET
jgi:hypothetical protein